MGVFTDAGLMFQSNSAGGTNTRTSIIYLFIYLFIYFPFLILQFNSLDKNISKGYCPSTKAFIIPLTV